MTIDPKKLTEHLEHALVLAKASVSRNVPVILSVEEIEFLADRTDYPRHPPLEEESFNKDDGAAKVVPGFFNDALNKTLHNNMEGDILSMPGHRYEV